MNNFWLLFKVNVASLLTVNGKNKKSKKVQAAKLSSVALLYTLLVGGIGTMYAFIFAETLKMTGDIAQLVPTMIGLSAVVSFAFSFYAVSSLLYGFKDYDLLASLPVTKVSIILSKLSAMLLIDLAFALLISVPALVFYALNATLTVGYVLSSLLYALLSPLLPITLSIIIGALFTFISAKTKFKNLISIVMYFMIFVVAFAFGFSSAEDGNMGFVQKLYFVFPLLVNGYSNVWYLLSYVGVSVVPFTLVILVVAATFDKMNALTKAHPKNKNFRLKEKGVKGEFRTLFAREFKRLGTCPLYIMNGLMGAIMPIVGAIALAVLFNSLPAEVAPVIAMFVVPFAPVLFVFCFGIAPTTNCAISLEGKAFWLTRTLPIDTKKLLNAKLAVNSVFYVVSALISTVIMAIVFRLEFLMAFLFVAFALALAIFFGVFALWVNLKKPMMDWDNIQKPVKQGASVAICVFFAMGLSCVFGVLAYFLMFGQGTILEFLTRMPLELYLGILTAIFLALGVWIYALIMKNGEKILAKLNG